MNTSSRITLKCCFFLIGLSSHSLLGEPPQTGAATSSSSSDYEANLVDAVLSFFQSQEAAHNGGQLSRAETLAPSKMPEALVKRVGQLAKVPADETIKLVQIANDWHNETLSTFEPHCLAVFSSKAIYLTGTWEARERRGFYVDRVSYKELMGKIKFSYDHRGYDDGVMEFDNGKTITSTSEAVQLLHLAAEVIGTAARQAFRSIIVEKTALPEADVRAIKGYSAVLWGASVDDVRNKFGVTLDKNAVTVDYANQRPSEVAQTWAHYQKFYPGIRLTTPLTTIQCNDNSGQLTFHFPGGRLQMVERQVSADIKKHATDALANMLSKYGEASRELCDFRFEGDRAVRFIWETQYGRIIALCDTWYPDHKLRDRVSVGKNELELDLNVVGNGHRAELHKDPNENDSWIAPDSDRDEDPNVMRTTGTFVQLKLKLNNKDQVQSWPFEGTVELQLIEMDSMKPLTTVLPSTGSSVKYTLPPDEPTNARSKSKQTLFLLFDVPLDKFSEVPTFSRLVVTPFETKEPIYSDFSVNRSSIEPVRSHFDAVKPLRSGAISDFTPANMRMALVSIAYSDSSLLKDIVTVDSQALRTAREEAEKKEAIEKEKVKAKASKDL